MKNKFLKIGGRQYEILFQDIAKELNINTDKQEVFGYIDYGQSKIVVEKSMATDAIKEHLTHELLHALLDRKNLELISRNSTLEEVVENIVEYLAPRFHAFLEDNPNFQKDFLNLK